MGELLRVSNCAADVVAKAKSNTTIAAKCLNRLVQITYHPGR